MSRGADYDIFVSYARADDTGLWITLFVEALRSEYRMLRGREAHIFFDTKAIRTGDDWEQRVHHALSSSQVFIAFVSPDYAASDWCRREWRRWTQSEIANCVFSDGALPISIIDVPVIDYSTDTSSFVDELRRRQVLAVHHFYREGIASFSRDSLHRMVTELAVNVADRADRRRIATNSLSNVPPYNTRFSGRIAELCTLRHALTSSGACCVNGLGGIGKTELVFAYAHACAGLYPGGRFWIPCGGKTSIRDATVIIGDLADFRAEIDDEARRATATLFAAICRCLSQRLEVKGNILLIFDNLEDTALISEQETDCLKVLGSGLHLLATTRLARSPKGTWLTLNELPLTDAMDLMERHRRFRRQSERDAAALIAKRLGGFTMAVELVAAWLEAHEGSNYSTVAGTIGLEDLETIAEDKESDLRRHNHERRLTAVLVPILSGLTSVERTTMEMAAFLPPDAVALPWLKKLVEEIFPGAWVSNGPIADLWLETHTHLTKLALFIHGSEADPSLRRVHRLVQDVIKHGMSSARISEYSSAVSLFIATRDLLLEEETQWDGARWELEAMEAAANLEVENGPAGSAWLLNQAGKRWMKLAAWARAEQLFRRTLRIVTTSEATDLLPEIAIASLAELFRETNQHGKAEAYFRQAIAIAETGHGPESIIVAASLTGLAHLFHDLGRLEEALPLMQRVLKIYEDSFGENNTDVARSLDHLGQLLLEIGAFSEAERLLRRALKITEEQFSREHPEVGVRIGNLAHLLKKTGRPHEAEPLMRRALAIAEASFGQFHPAVATCLNNLAILLFSTNRVDDAEPLMRLAVEIVQMYYEPDNPRVVAYINNLNQILATKAGQEFAG